MADLTDETLEDDELQRPSLPQEELPEDDAEQLEEAETTPKAQPMPGWFKFALFLVPVILAGVGYAGYQYLSDEFGAKDFETQAPQTAAQEGWAPPSFGESGEGRTLAETNQDIPDPGDADVSQSDASSDTEETDQPPNAGGYAINDTREPEPPRLTLDVSLPSPARSRHEPGSEPARRPATNSSATASVTDSEASVPEDALADIRDSLQSIQQTLTQHREELSRMNSLITNNEVSIQQHAEDLATLSERVKQAPRPSSKKEASPPRLDIALISMQQMGGAQAVGVRYRGRNTRLLLGQTIDGWRLSQVLIDEGAARFTHSSSGHAITVKF